VRTPPPGGAARSAWGALLTPDLPTLRAFFASAPFMADLGIEPVEAGEGRVVTQLTLAPRHHQHTGVVHAGVIGAMADHTMGAAGRGRRLQCIGVVVKPGRQVSFTEAEVFALDGDARTLVAKASATMAVVKA
jgi:acyl-coenzyme A thioesterase PaaI-like protein